MKNILKNIGLIIGVIALFLSCEKDEDRVVIKSTITPNVLSALSSSSYVLNRNFADSVLTTFQWTAVDYGFDASIDYILQVDIAENNFAKAVEISSVTSELSSKVLVSAMNKALLNLELSGGTEADLEFRIAAVINSHVDTVFSNTITAKITPYALAFPPIYMCGAATGGWDWTKDVEVRSSAASVYYTIAYFINGESFRFFAQRDWNPTSYNYPYFTTVDSDLENANDGDKNFKVVGATGYYAITVNLSAKTVVMEPVAEPAMYMTGAALGGWDWTTNYVQMTWLPRYNKFVATTDFANGEAFRFFAQNDWSPLSYNYPYFSNGSVSTLLENALDGDKNFRFIGTTGSYKITLNLQDLIITMEAAKK